ncbi:MAG: class I SAM-dependent methyltransferase [Sterolibacteriaceae bacterium]|nr:class I SAM-dependent methyltransferase [Candidatus Methylophosphatis haderslevensis]
MRLPGAGGVADHLSIARPSPWVERFADLVQPGAKALDLACGGGRHSRLLAARGAQVTAVDRDAAAIAALAGVPGVRALCADVENGPWPLVDVRFDAIVVTNYLHRALFPHLRGCLGAGALLIYETFMVGNERFGKPSNPDFLLRPGELLGLCAGMWIVAFEQGEIDQPKPAMVQRICAIEPPAAGVRIP